MRQFIFPTRICAEENVSNSKAVFIKRFLQVDLFEQDLLTVENGGFIVLDFGKEMCGGVRILTSNAVNGGDYVKVRVRFGESLSETYAELGEKNATNHHAPRDMMQILPACIVKDKIIYCLRVYKNVFDVQCVAYYKNGDDWLYGVAVDDISNGELPNQCGHLVDALYDLILWVNENYPQELQEFKDKLNHYVNSK